MFEISGDALPDANLTIVFGKVSGGAFLRQGVKVQSFTLDEVAAGAISFVHDGKLLAPVMTASLIDSFGLKSTPFSPVMNFTQANDAPVARTKTITLSSTKPTSLSAALSLTDEDNTLSELSLAITSSENLVILQKRGANFIPFTQGSFNGNELASLYVRSSDAGHASALHLRLSDPTSPTQEIVVPLRWKASAPSGTSVPVLSSLHVSAEGTEEYRLTASDFNVSGRFEDLTFTAAVNAAEFRLNGSKTSTFTGAEVEAGAVSFAALSKASKAPSFTIQAVDAFGQKSAKISGLVDWVDTPVLMPPKSLSLREDGELMLSAATLGLRAIDKQLTFTLTRLEHATLIVNGLESITFDYNQLISKQVKLHHDGSKVATSLTLKVTNEAGGSAEALLPFAFQTTNFAPHLYNRKAVLEEGGYLKLSTDFLDARDDITPTSQLVFKVVSLAHGELRRDTGEAVARFTQADLAAGKIYLVHSDGTNAAPVLRLSVSDGALSSAPQVLQLDFGAHNSSPMLSWSPWMVNSAATVKLNASMLHATDADLEDGPAQLRYTHCNQPKKIITSCWLAIF